MIDALTKCCECQKDFESSVMFSKLLRKYVVRPLLRCQDHEEDEIK